MADRPVRVAVVGLGYWGPNLARNFAGLGGCEVAWLCDADPDVKRVVDVAKGLEGLKRSDGIHAAAVVITNERRRTVGPAPDPAR